ncbi:C4-dicarboxylate ABC transporter substrate-binding protein [Sagittula sp. P11]|uniref:TRAP transporter substrate-binding protein n=1 Tax=Sagittula sp. P11 TaxID=2009329 RepID=UPI000C2CE6B1|nr:TRAP transporter substrate-binding protein [Sagittula sp. P11]AUC54394.1 C4-dicarboxylate ABC transporter substrate-binding protein [Sagittula sp. P11]
MKRQIFALATSVLALATSVLALAAAAQADTIRVAGNFATDHSSSVAMETFAEKLAELSGGEFDVNLFPARQLGGAAENVQAVKLGAVEIIWVGTAYLTRTVPELEIVGLPFQFETREDAFAVVDGPVGDALDEKLAAQDIMSLGYMELGFRQLTNSVRPIETLEDIAGLKIRLQPNETHLATFRALGANPLAMDVNELYSALEQKVIDGQENPFSIIQVAGYPEVQEYVSNTGHFFDFISVVANKKWFDGLSEEKQGWVTEAMDAAVAEQRVLAAEQDGAALDKIVEMGMTYTEVSPELAAALRETVAGVAAETKARLDPELVELLDAQTSGVSN